MNAADATRLAGDAYSTRLVRDVPATSDDKTRIAQEGYQSKLARDGSRSISGRFESHLSYARRHLPSDTGIEKTWRSRAFRLSVGGS